MFNEYSLFLRQWTDLATQLIIYLANNYHNYVANGYDLLWIL